MAVQFTVSALAVTALKTNASMTTGAAIDIQTNNVVLDLNGFKLGGLAAGPGTNAFGVAADNSQNLTIKNGTICGFQTGIRLGDAGASQGHVVEDIRADQNTAVGIDVRGSGTIVRNNQVVATGGSTAFGANVGAIGIVVFGGTGPQVAQQRRDQYGGAGDRDSLGDPP